MENRTPEERSARREFELLVLLGGSRKGAVQLWKWERRQRIYANAQQSAGRPATEAKGSRGAAERQAGGKSKPETAAQAARRHHSERRLREKHLARKVWAAVRVHKHFSCWCQGHTLGSHMVHLLHLHLGLVHWDRHAPAPWCI